MIRTRHLTKDFTPARGKTVHAVRGITLDVEPGELVAVLGPNGAGKTTTIRMLTTLIAPTAGTATVAGHDVVTEAAQVRRHIGYVGQGNGAGHSQRSSELVSQARAFGMSRRQANERADELRGVRPHRVASPDSLCCTSTSSARRPPSTPAPSPRHRD